MLMNRIAPANGYDNDAKAEYRRQVWCHLKKALDAHPHIGNFLIMPSAEGLEIDLAIELGIPPHRIVAIDRDPRVLDKGSWRERHPTVICIASEISELHRVFKKQFCCANLDLCGRFSDETFDTIVNFMTKGPKKLRPFYFGVTIAKGREDSTTFMLLKKLTGGRGSRGIARGGRKFWETIKDIRMAVLLSIVAEEMDPDYRFKWEPLGQGSYVSGRHPMTWAAISIGRKEHMERVNKGECGKRDDVRNAKIIAMHLDGKAVIEIMGELKARRTTVYRILQLNGLAAVTPHREMQERLNAAFASL